MVMDSSRLGRGRRALQRDGGGIAPAAINIVYLDRYYFTAFNFPDTTFGSGTFSRISINSSGEERIGVMKFTRTITSSDPSYSLLVFRTLDEILLQVTASNTQEQGVVFFRLDIFKIIEDFDPSIVTHNNFGDLDTLKISSDSGWLIQRAHSIVIADTPGAELRQSGSGNVDDTDLVFNNNRSYSYNLEDARGLLLRLNMYQALNGPTAWSAQIDLLRSTIFRDSFAIANLE